MRDLLTYIGIALIALLTAALAAPFVIDFDAHRARIADEIAAASGAEVAIDGPLSLRLLPTPQLAAENVEASGEAGSLKAKSIFVELSLPALIQGRLQFSQARCESCAMSLDTAKLLRVKGAAMQFDRIVLRDARLALARSDAPALVLENLDLSASAPSLAGPWRGEGAATSGGERIVFSFASDAVAKGALPLKASLSASGETGRLQFDGRLDLAAAPRFEGQARANGQAPPGPWQAEGEISAGLDSVEVKSVAARLGEGPLAAKIAGEGRYEAKSEKVALDLNGSTIDAAWTAWLAAPLLDAGARTKPLDLHLHADSLDWRGATWGDVDIARQTGKPLALRGKGPGGARVDLAATADQGSWRGMGNLAIADFGAFVAALPDARPLAGARIGAVGVGGDFTWSPGDFGLNRGKFDLDRVHLQGDLRYRSEAPGRRPSLTAHLASSALDLDAAPELAGAPPDSVDLDLALDAQTVRIGRNGQAYGEAGHVKAHFLREGETSRLEALEMQKIGGADLSASAEWRRELQGLKGEARLKAQDMSEIARIFARLFPSDLARAVALRGKAFSPADLVGRASGGGGFSLGGALGGAKLAASLAPGSPGKWSASLDLAAPDAGVLLGQLGAPLLTAQKLGAAHLLAKAEMAPNEPMGVAATAELAGAHGDFHGAVADFEGSPDIHGDLALTGDFSRILAGLGATAAPLRVQAKLDQRGASMRLSAIDGAWGATRFSGDLSSGDEGVVGALRCDRLQAQALAALVLGAPAPAKAGAHWPSLSFAPVVADPPRLRKLTVETEDLQPFGGKAHFDLALGPGLLSASDARIETGGGTLSGALDLRREGAQVTVSGDAQAEGMTAKTPAISAGFGGKLHFAGHGESLAALIGSLAGAGEFRADRLVVAGAALAGPDEALALTETNAAPFDAAAAARSLDAVLAGGDAELGQVGLSARLADGRLVLAREEGAEPRLDLSYDLRDATMTLVLSIVARKTPEGWSAPPPRAGVVWSGPWAAPSRRVDSTGFVNAVATRALEREQARVEEMKARDRERLRALAPPPEAGPGPAQ